MDHGSNRGNILALRSLDLNLLHVFEAVMRHRSVSATARELGLTPSAVSHALARLRKTLGDELLVAGPSGMEPTPRALELAPRVSDGMQRLLDALDNRPFLAAESIRSFTIAATDYPTTAWLPYLVARLISKAPHTALRVFPIGRMDTVRLLDEGRVDLILGWFEDVPDRLRRAVIVVEQEALIVRTGHPLTHRVLTKGVLLEYPFVVVEITGSENQGAGGFLDDRGLMRRNWIDRLLIENGEPGTPARILVTVPTYAAVPQIVAMTDLVATMPRQLAQQAVRAGNVVMLELPYKPLEVNVEAIWHQRSDRDQALMWLIAEFMAATREKSFADQTGQASP